MRCTFMNESVEKLAPSAHFPAQNVNKIWSGAPATELIKPPFPLSVQQNLTTKSKAITVKNKQVPFQDYFFVKDLFPLRLDKDM